MSTIHIAGSRLSHPHLLGSVACDFDFTDPSTLRQAINGSGAAPGNGQLVGYATDQSGNGYHINAPANGNRPTWQSGVIGSTGATLFDGVNDYLERAASNISANRSALTVYAVVKHAATPTGREPYMMVSYDNGNAVRAEMGPPTSPTNAPRLSGRRVNADTLDSVIGTTPVGMGIRLFTGVLDYANDTVALYMDGQQEAITTSFQTGSSSQPTQNTNGKIFVGGQGSVYMNGHIFRILMYWDAHNEAQRQAVWGYLRNSIGF